MHSLSSSIITAASLLAVGCAQSPPGFQPATANHLTVTYGGVDVRPAGITLQASQAVNAPSLALTGSNAGPFVAIMLDLSVQTPQSAPGNTTLLHWILPGLNRSSGSALASSQKAIAPYIGPGPPAGQTHTYALFLYNESDDFAVPANYVPFFNNLTASVYNRIGFDISNFTDETNLGEPIASDYFLVGTPAGTPTASSGAAATPSVVTRLCG